MILWYIFLSGNTTQMAQEKIFPHNNVLSKKQTFHLFGIEFSFIETHRLNLQSLVTICFVAVLVVTYIAVFLRGV